MEAIVLSSHLFKSLDDEGRQRVIESGYVQSYVPLATIVRQGDPGNAMYLILSGSVRVEMSTPSGALVHLADLHRGACFGEVAVLSGSERTATVTALTPVDLVGFERERLLRLLGEYPRVMTMLQVVVEGRARDTIEKIIG